MGKKPALRFEGYTEDWEQHKLEKYLEVSTEKNASGVYGKEDVLSVSGDHGIVNQIEFKGRSFAGASVLNYGVVYTGDVVYTKSPLNTNPYGIIKTNKGKTGIVSTLYAVYHPKTNCFADFAQTYFEQHARMNNYMHPLVNKGAKNDMKVSAENALKGDVIFPDITEQKTISKFFDTLDQLMVSHQSNYEKMVATKKSMLQKMFLADDSDAPEVRFSQFKKPWDRCKLKNIADRITDKNTEYLFDEVFTNSAEYGIVSQRSFFDHDIAKKVNLNSYYIVQHNDFVYNPRISVTAPVGPINRNKTGRTGVMSPLYTVFRTHDIDRAYLEYFFKTEYWHSFMFHNGNTGARYDRFSIKDELFFDMPIPLPSIEEQRQIAGFLSSLEDLIELYRIRIEKLKNIKAACLQGMFV